MEPTSLYEELAQRQIHIQSLRNIVALLVHRQGGHCEIPQEESVAFMCKNHRIEAYVDECTNNFVLTLKEEKDG